ncbi:MAG: ABC transporter ATP-binding protein [Chloroflexota bacterium]|nr:MAG: ABC transporter ATP-binding protein [Chloroflexota bacterium]
MLTLEDVSFGYGPIVICHDLNLEIQPGEVVCLLGRNGMGKTTLLEGLMGLNRQTQGRILFKGANISGDPTHLRAKRGLGWVPQGRRIFPDISVRDNLRLGSLTHHAQSQAMPEVIFDYFPVLSERLDQKGNTLSGGEQQMLAIGRTLASQPDLMLLDEPSEGLAPLIVDAIGQLIIRLRNEGMTFLLAEQNLPFALSVASRGYVLEKGRIVDAGDVTVLQSHKVVRDYLMV